MIARFLDWLLGSRCPRCRNRVFDHDAARHHLDCT